MSQLRITWVDLETPVVSEQRGAIVSWVEFAAPIPAVAGTIEISVTDSGQLQSAEVVADDVLVALSAQEDSHIVAQDSAILSANYLADDSTSITDSDTSITSGAVLTTDSTAINVVDTMLDVFAPRLTNDASIVSSNENLGLLRTSENIDTSVIHGTEQSSIDTYVISTDTTQIIAQEQTDLFISTRIQLTDTESIAATETIAQSVARSVADQYTVRINEVVGDRGVSFRPEVRDVGSIETAYLLRMATRTDVTQPLHSTESFIGPFIQTSEENQINVLDTIELFRAIELVDSSWLTANDRVDLDVIYENSNVLLRMLRQQTENIGFSRIGRGW